MRTRSLRLRVPGDRWVAWIAQHMPLAFTLALNLLGVLPPKFIQYAIDWYILPRKTEGITLFALLYVAANLLRFIFSYFQAVMLNSIGQYVMFDLRRELYNKLQRQEVAYYDRNPVGRIMTRLTADVDALNEMNNCSTIMPLTCSCM